jgi:hypothetical protein
MRFGLKTLLVGMSVLCVAFFLLFPAPTEFAVPALVVIDVSLAAFVTAGLVYGSPIARAFCIGALFPAGGTIVALVCVLCIWLSSGFVAPGPADPKDFPSLFAHFEHGAFTLRVWSAASWVMAAVVGLLTVGLKIPFQQKGATGHEDLAKGQSESLGEVEQ